MIEWLILQAYSIAVSHADLCLLSSWDQQAATGAGDQQQAPGDLPPREHRKRELYGR